MKNNSRKINHIINDLILNILAYNCDTPHNVKSYYFVIYILTLVCSHSSWVSPDLMFQCYNFFSACRYSRPFFCLDLVLLSFYKPVERSKILATCTNQYSWQQHVFPWKELVKIHGLKEKLVAWWSCLSQSILYKVWHMFVIRWVFKHCQEV